MERPSRRRVAWIAAGASLALLVLAVFLLSRPERVARFALDRAGNALGLEITASGASEYRIRGTPTLVVRDVEARMPGAQSPLLTADRVLLSMPWSTLRARLQDLDFTRVELDGPVLDLDALQAWLASRPPGDGRVPTLREGIVVVDGTVVADGWRVEAIDLEVPLLHADRPLRAHATGRYASGTTTLPFDLHAVVARPAPGQALGIAGVATVEADGWRLPARVRMGGTWQADDDGWGIARMKFGARTAYVTDETRAPFALGVFGPLRIAAGRTTLAPLHATVIPLGDAATNPIPRLGATGVVAVADRLELDLDGTIAHWPAAWPALPAPLEDAAAETAFGLRYAGAASLDDVADLTLYRAGASADARLRLPSVTAWIGNMHAGSPLPPLDATARIPRLEIAGAVMHGVELTLDDPALEVDD